MFGGLKAAPDIRQSGPAAGHRYVLRGRPKVKAAAQRQTDAPGQERAIEPTLRPLPLTSTTFAGGDGHVTALSTLALLTFAATLVAANASAAGLSETGDRQHSCRNGFIASLVLYLATVK